MDNGKAYIHRLGGLNINPSLTLYTGEMRAGLCSQRIHNGALVICTQCFFSCSSCGTMAGTQGHWLMDVIKKSYN